MPLDKMNQIIGNKPPKMNTDPPIVRHVLSMVGAHRGDSPTDRPGDLGQPHLGQVTVELSPSEQREMGAKEIANRWRALTGAIPGTEALTYTGEMRNFGDPIAIELRGGHI